MGEAAAGRGGGANPVHVRENENDDDDDDDDDDAMHDISAAMAMVPNLTLAMVSAMMAFSASNRHSEC
jgi:hypothetical protein